jgi:hypothetical protein
MRSRSIAATESTVLSRACADAFSPRRELALAAMNAVMLAVAIPRSAHPEQVA